ncbi:MAG: transcriptional repressor NrdR [Anaerolineae bacterium]|nr:transcriptional repressor NrdR [Anaerolineae bacterium]
MKCPSCGAISGGAIRHRVIDTSPDAQGGVRRRRECGVCGCRFSTYERAIRSTPMLVKSGGAREEFDRDKLIAGVKLACAKRPVATADIERLADRVEAYLQRLGQSEVNSRVVGQRVIEELRELDAIAYVRFAIVFLKMNDLQAVRDEINRLLEDSK